MRYGNPLVLCSLLVGCSTQSPPWLAGDWKCSARDGNGNTFYGVAADRQTALGKAHWQCVSGSPYKPSCKVEPAYCEQFE